MIPVNEPVISKNAKKYVLDCLDSGWISSSGKYVEKFENEFAKFIGIKYAASCSSGTSALHLAVASLGIKKGDEVIIPDLTIISTALAVVYTGATPVLVDVDLNTGNIDPGKIEEKISKKTKAIIVVHLYGHPADMGLILDLAQKYNLWVIEDAAEAHGAEVRVEGRGYRVESESKKEAGEWKKVGSIGDIGCFSFYGNKIITTGEGGMVVTDNKKIYEKLKSLRDLAHIKGKRFLHSQIGFSYRLTNMQAALGLAQLEEVDEFINKKFWIANEYHKRLRNIPNVQLPYTSRNVKNVYWMFTLKIQNSNVKTQNLLGSLKKKGIETREFFIPMHKQPALLKLGLFLGEKYPVSEDLSKRGFYIPSGLAITKDQIQTVANSLVKALNELY